MTIIHLSEKLQDARLWSPEQCLLNALETLKEEPRFNKVLILFLNDQDEQNPDGNNNPYDVSWSQAGMSLSECVSLCAVGQQLFTDDLIIPRYED